MIEQTDMRCENCQLGIPIPTGTVLPLPEGKSFVNTGPARIERLCLGLLDVLKGKERFPKGNSAQCIKGKSFVRRNP